MSRGSFLWNLSNFRWEIKELWSFVGKMRFAGKWAWAVWKWLSLRDFKLLSGRGRKKEAVASNGRQNGVQMKKLWQKNRDVAIWLEVGGRRRSAHVGHAPTGPREWAHVSQLLGARPDSKNSEKKLINSSKIEIYRPVQKYLSFGLSSVSIFILTSLILHENAVSG